MSPIRGSDNKILDYLEQLEGATPNAPSFDDLHLYDAPQRSRLVPLAGAAVVVTAGLVGIVAVSADDPGQPAQGDPQTETTTTLAPLTATGWACTDPRAFDGPTGYKYFDNCFTVDGVDIASIPPSTMPQAVATTTRLPALTVTGWACTAPRAFDGPTGYEYFDECFPVDGVDMSSIAETLRPDGRILVVNASSTARLAGELSDALTLSGYDVLEPENAVGGAVVEASVMYTQPDMPNWWLPTIIANAVPIGDWITLADQPTPMLTQEMRDSTDMIIVAGNDLADARWLGAGTPLVDPGIGRLLIVDATTTADGHHAAAARADELRSAGVDVAGVVTATAALERSVLMPIGEPTLWTFAIAELTGIGGLDTWNPRLVTGEIPDGVTAALVIGN